MYRGYLDDPQNTDNAWIEVTCVEVHEEREELNSASDFQTLLNSLSADQLDLLSLVYEQTRIFPLSTLSADRNWPHCEFSKGLFEQPDRNADNAEGLRRTQTDSNSFRRGVPSLEFSAETGKLILSSIGPKENEARIPAIVRKFRVKWMDLQSETLVKFSPTARFLLEHLAISADAHFPSV